MGSDEAFCLKWNDFQGSISSSLSSLRNASDLLDVSLQCGTESLRCHRLVLSACSDWFKTVFRALPVTTQNPVIVLWEATARDMALLLDFMYYGEVNVKQENLNSFLALAEKLSVRGLTQGQDGSSSQGGGKEREKIRELTRQSHSSASISRKEDNRIEAVKRQDHNRVPVQQHTDVEEVAVVKQEVTREIEPVEQVVDDYDGYHQGGEVAQYEGENMYDSYYEGGEGVEADYGQMDSNQTFSGSKGRFQNGPGICPYCNKNVQQLAYHVEDKHFPNPTPCPICGKVYNSINKMRVHKSTAHKSKPVSYATY